MKFLFFFSLFMILYIYLGYPILVFLFGIFKNRKVNKGAYEPNVTILIAAYNEKNSIEATLSNKLDLDYPPDKLEIIVVSDGSTDKTDHIVKQYAGRGVKLLRQEPRAGKTAALNMAVPEAKGDILVFSDSNSIYAQDALRWLVANFGDPSVGYVTGRMMYSNQDSTNVGDGCTAYMKYENYLRSIETKSGSIVGVDGGIDAIRRGLYKPMKPEQLPDFVLPLKVAEQGYRVVYEPNAILKEPALKNIKDEYHMRVRVSLRALWAISDMRHLLTFTGSKLFAWQLWSHKVLRYFSFVFLLGAYFSNLALWPESIFYKLFFMLQNVCCFGAIISPLLEKNAREWRVLYLLHYFVLLNLAGAHAFFKFLLGQKQAIWTPRKG